MLLTLSYALLLQGSVTVGPPRPRPQPTVVRDSTDSTRRNAPRRLPVTAEVLATAFKDPAAKDLFYLAQRARLQQDSALRSYEAKAVERLSVGVATGANARDRLAFRRESAAKVKWQAGVGAWVDLTGARVGIPMLNAAQQDDALRGSLTDAEMSPIPYFPGYESLWVGAPTARAEVNERNVVNPLARGAEAYYTFATGDSVRWILPDSTRVQIRELQVRPRTPEWNVAVGSLWLDTKTGQVVRAAYRLAIPLDLWVEINDELRQDGRGDGAPALATAFASPLNAQITAVAIEYGRYRDFWLPRLRSMEGKAQLLFVRVPVTIETAFTYASVNGFNDLPPIPLTAADRIVLRPPPQGDTAARRQWQDSIRAVNQAAARAQMDSIQLGLRGPPGSRTACWRNPDSSYVVTRYRYDVRLPVALRIPCDIEKLKASPDLPPSIYASNEQTFGVSQTDQLIADALGLAAQAPLTLGNLFRPKVQWGLSMTRYNRVEGLSSGALVEAQIGAGYSASLVGRLGVADLEPNGELSLARSNARTTLRGTAYHRLVSVGDRGDPLSFGASLSAFLFGRDEGFYVRTTGGELTWTTSRGAKLAWRAFAERHRTAVVNTDYAVSGSLGPNIVAAEGLYAGASVRSTNTIGLDPQGFRLLSDVRLEGAGGDSTYGRGVFDVTLSRGIGARYAAALTLGGGSSVGAVPLQRHWFLGGTQTVRGQSPDTAQHGNAFWLARAEIAQSKSAVRTALFGDLGWVGDRSRVGDVGRPMSGVGLGWSLMDGMIRFDVARGLYPREQTRVDIYLEARW